MLERGRAAVTLEQLRQLWTRRVLARRSGRGFELEQVGRDPERGGDARRGLLAFQLRQLGVAGFNGGRLEIARDPFAFENQHAEAPLSRVVDEAVDRRARQRGLRPLLTPHPRKRVITFETGPIGLRPRKLASVINAWSVYIGYAPSGAEPADLDKNLEDILPGR